MKRLLTRTILVTLAAGLLTAAAVALGGGVPAAVHYIGHDKVTQVMSKVRGEAIVSDPGLVFWRNAGTPVRLNTTTSTNHVFILSRARRRSWWEGPWLTPSAPGQSNACPSVNGGTTYHVSKGDVITIPAKTPHWFKEVPTKTIAYYAVNIESK